MEENNNIATFSSQNNELNNNMTKSPEFNADKALQYLLLKKSLPSKDIDKAELNEIVTLISEECYKGFSIKFIHDLCFSIVFSDSYDAKIRKRLLHSCIPLSRDEFPYKVIPLSVSFASMSTVSKENKKVILWWILGLLQYQLIDINNNLIRICYTAFFQFLSDSSICFLACQILTIITQRHDVTDFRVQELVRLKKYPKYENHIPHLLRVYRIYRPDRVAFRYHRLSRLPQMPPPLKKTFLKAISKTSLDSAGNSQFEVMWPKFGLSCANPYQGASCIDNPEFFVHATTIEDKKRKSIPIIQYKNIHRMVKKVSQWKEWQWPNNAHSLLCVPEAIALFQTNNAKIKVNISNWLVIVLQTEVIDRMTKSKARRDDLLNAIISLLRYFDEDDFLIGNFLYGFFERWDLFSHFSQIMKLLKYIPFTDELSFKEVILDKISKLLLTDSISDWCRVVNALGDMCFRWGRQHFKRKNRPDDLPQEIDDILPLEGIYFMSEYMKLHFLYIIDQQGARPVVLLTCINFYKKINNCSDRFQLPIFVLPPIEFFLSVVVSDDLVAIDSLGMMLYNMRYHVDRIKSLECDLLEEEVVADLCLSHIERGNFIIRLFLDAVVHKNSFNYFWREKIGPFLSENVWETALSTEGIFSVSTLTTVLPIMSLTDSIDGDETEEEQQKILHLIKLLAEKGLSGTQKCFEAYVITPF